ncbi:hypothetical protein LMG29542_08667 [Paraburkholderia humisilvae]|uniref:Uncharacterized protein n=1 Tax=Paraburkholderia humisilvae TaxID=627669 RepID=A0A6J5FDI6_9BURK|nr:hypothetical protein LMG29542_08667 [Paraburkholderia humisilvae]
MAQQPSQFMPQQPSQFMPQQAQQNIVRHFGEQCYSTEHLQRLGENGICATLTAKILKESFAKDITQPPSFLRNHAALEREHNAYEARRATRHTT